jgi:hypothetical protein
MSSAPDNNRHERNESFHPYFFSTQWRSPSSRRPPTEKHAVRRREKSHKVEQHPSSIERKSMKLTLALLTALLLIPLAAPRAADAPAKKRS